MEDKIKSLLESATTIKVLESASPDIFPSITFHIYNEDGALFGGGKATEERASCQVDIWYKVKNSAVKIAINSIKQAIITERQFTHPSKETMFENDKGIYHTHMNFEFILESEE